MASFNIDGLIYTDKLPHSRIERLLYSILKKQGGGSGGDSLVIDDPDDLGNGLHVSGNSITIDAIDSVDSSSSNPITSNAVYNQLETINTIMSRI